MRIAFRRHACDDLLITALCMCTVVDNANSLKSINIKQYIKLGKSFRGRIEAVFFAEKVLMGPERQLVG